MSCCWPTGQSFCIHVPVFKLTTNMTVTLHVGAPDTWRSRDLRSTECASLTTSCRILHNSPLQSVTGVWNLKKLKIPVTVSRLLKRGSVTIFSDFLRFFCASKKWRLLAQVSRTSDLKAWPSARPGSLATWRRWLHADITVPWTNDKY